MLEVEPLDELLLLGQGFLFQICDILPNELLRENCVFPTALPHQAGFQLPLWQLVEGILVGRQCATFE